MKEVRFSIPFIGGPTVIFTKEEAEKKLSAAKTWIKDHPNTCTSIVGNLLGTAIVWAIVPKITVAVVLVDAAITALTVPVAYYVDKKVLSQAGALGRPMVGVVVTGDACPSCGATRVDGVCVAHGSR
jgi:hypothetical protein